MLIFPGTERPKSRIQEYDITWSIEYCACLSLLFPRGVHHHEMRLSLAVVIWIRSWEQEFCATCGVSVKQKPLQTVRVQLLP